MAKHSQLNSAQHKNLRIRTERSAELGDAMMACPIFPQEFRDTQAFYPIVFSKDAQSGLFRPFTLFGLEEEENLFLSDARWDAPYVPLAIRMQPFLIGFAGQPGPETPMEVHIDLDHPRVSTEQGEALFHEHGGETEFLEGIASLLGSVHEGEQTVASFSAMLTELDLVEPFTLDITLDNGESGRLAGYYTIAEERLYSLAADDLGRLQEAGMLQSLFMAVASLSQFLNLITRKNRQIGKGAL